MKPPRFLLGTMHADGETFIPISPTNPLQSSSSYPDYMALSSATIAALAAAIGTAVTTALLAAALLAPLKVAPTLATGASSETTLAAINTKIGSTLATAQASLTAALTTSASIATTAVQVIGSNAARKGFRMYNNSANSVYFTYSAPPCGSGNITGILATFANYTETQPYTGPICAIRNAGTGTVTITELQ